MLDALQKDGLIYAADVSGFLFCFDAKTDNLYWTDDLKSGVRGQLLWADGKVLVAIESECVLVFAHGKERKLLPKVAADEWFVARPVFANGTLCLTTNHTLYAIRDPKGGGR